MANRGMTTQTTHHRFLRKIIPHQAQPPLRIEPRSIKRNNAGCFLPTMLERVQTKGNQFGGVFMDKYAKHATFLVRFVVVKVERIGRKC